MTSPVMQIDVELDESPTVIEVDFSEETSVLSMEMDEHIVVGMIHDYRELDNLPTINGTPLIDNYDEIDPTVPSWAKTDKKPKYTAEEVGAIGEDSEMSFSDVKSVWDSVFSK